MTRTFRQLRSTIGNFDIGAGQTNVIRHRAVITVDLRNPDDDLGLSCVRAMSGAGHDVVLVAGGNGGISHTPREYSNAACANVTDVLANAALRLADQP